MAKQPEELTKFYRLIVDGKPYKTYDNVGRLKLAIHNQSGWRHRKLDVEVYDVRPALVVDPSIIMGGPQCPECHQWPHTDPHYSHGYGCSLAPK